MLVELNPQDHRLTAPTDQHDDFGTTAGFDFGQRFDRAGDVIDRATIDLLDPIIKIETCRRDRAAGFDKMGDDAAQTGRIGAPIDGIRVDHFANGDSQRLVLAALRFLRRFRRVTEGEREFNFLLVPQNGQGHVRPR